MNPKLLKMINDQKAVPMNDSNKSQAMRDVLMEMKKLAMELMHDDLKEKSGMGHEGHPDMVALKVSAAKDGEDMGDEAESPEEEAHESPEDEAMEEADGLEAHGDHDKMGDMSEGDDMDKLRMLMKAKKA